MLLNDPGKMFAVLSPDDISLHSSQFTDLTDLTSISGIDEKKIGFRLSTVSWYSFTIRVKQIKAEVGSTSSEKRTKK